LLNAYIRVIFCTLLFLLILCSRKILPEIMKIFVNARFLTQKLTGVQRYGIECSRQIKKLYPEAIFLTPGNIVHNNIANQLNAVVIGTQTGIRWEQIELPAFMNKTGNAPLLNLANTAPLFYGNNYVTIHDLAFYCHPEWNSKLFSLWYNWMVPRIAKRASHVFTVSETVKNELVSYYKLPAQKISVTYNGIAEEMLQYHKPKTKEKIILSVGTFNIRKNHHKLLGAFAASDLKDDYKLVIIGDRNKIFKDIQIDRQVLDNEKIVFLQHVSDDELIEMYNKAELVVSLSTYEGFGIPLLEGLFFGCRIVCSDIPVYRELYEGYADYCNPNDTGSIISALTETIRTKKNSPDISGLLAKYNYQTAAKKILYVIKN
jgi:glycosyltransferase involved in cell wall biosynthesis